MHPDLKLAPTRVEWCTKCHVVAVQLPLRKPREPIHRGCGGKVRFRLLTEPERRRIALAHRDDDSVAIILSGARFINAEGVSDPTGEVAQRNVDRDYPPGRKRTTPAMEPGPLKSTWSGAGGTPQSTARPCVLACSPPCHRCPTSTADGEIGGAS